MEDAKDDLRNLVWGQAEQRAAQGDASYVRELGVRLADQYAAASEQARKCQGDLAYVVRVLALTPGRDSLVQLLRLLDEKQLPIRPEPIASLLAEHQQVADLASLVFDTRGPDELDELRTCLFHELLLRGVDMDAYCPLRSWPIARPGWHTLNWLPVHRRALEAGADFPSRSMRGGSGGSGTRLPDEGRVDPPTPRTSERSALRDVATMDVYESIVSAPHAGDWGACGAWVFMVDEAIAPDQVPALLPTLPMPCVEVGPAGRFEIAVRPVDEIWRLLFAGASMGGVGGSGVHGAWGRMWAWRSMAGLCGAPADADAETVEHCARRSTWFHFEADADWFHNEIGADYGIAALSPDRRRVAVLAATDTD